MRFGLIELASFKLGCLFKSSFVLVLKSSKSQASRSYSVLKLFTGLPIAALMD